LQKYENSFCGAGAQSLAKVIFICYKIGFSKGMIMNNFLVFLVFILVSGLGSNALASEKTKRAVDHLSRCGNFLRADETAVFTGFGPYWTGSLHNRTPRPSVLKWIKLDNLQEDQVATDDSVVDLVSHQGSTYVLTYSRLEQWDLASGQRQGLFHTHSTDGRFGDEEHAKAMALYQDKLIIAHGRLGISFFNLKSKQVTKTLKLISQGSLESMAQGVTVSGKYAFVVLDSYTLVPPTQKGAFRGIVVIDMETEQIAREIGDLPPGLDSIASDENSLVLSFYGKPLWKYAISDVLGAKKIQPKARVFKFSLDGSPKGKAFMDSKYYYSCFSQAPAAGQGSYFTPTQIVINRQQFMLE
jgi:hypothetical protein